LSIQLSGHKSYTSGDTQTEGSG